MNPPVPTPRKFLTSLIQSLSSLPTSSTSSSPSSSSPPQPAAPGAGAANPLKLIPPAHRPVLTTLYALYPLTLLPALDLLDRRLATRIIVTQQDTGTTSTSAPLPKPTSTVASNTNTNADADTDPPREQNKAPGRINAFYLVRSAQPQHPRRHGGDASSSSSSHAGPRYVVRLDAWNCTCAAFAFAAFPRGEEERASAYGVGSPVSSGLQVIDEEREGEKALDEEEGEWQFGALSRDGVDGSGIAGVPCCKHLLACVLAERWSGLLGGYVDERVVGREEAAGLVADI